MRILALEPYYSGSHRYFLDEWIKRSRHSWQLLTFPGHHWKWRMRHAAISFARRVRELQAESQVVFCTDMVNLAEFRGLAPADTGRLPAVCYFHENQMTYPVRFPMERDHHFGMNNFVAAVSADAVWFNSEYHRSAFSDAMEKWLRKMPEDRCLADFADLAGKSSVQTPGIEVGESRVQRTSGPLRIAWAARWEHDKAPELFFAAIGKLKDAGREFRLSVLGESFKDVPAIFAAAKQRFGAHIDDWGFAQDRGAYLSALRRSDVFVSTARHEFFGLSACEAMGQGAVPLLPNRLAYPELLNLDVTTEHSIFFYDGSVDALADKLSYWSERAEVDDYLVELGEIARKCISRFAWHARAKAMDDALAGLRPQARGAT